MTDESWRAPRVFRTHAGAVDWALERNPYRPGSPAFSEWLLLYWRDQRDRGLARADRSVKRALIAAILAIVANIVGVVISTMRLFG